MTDPDQDILDFYNARGSPSPGGSPAATMTPEPDQDIMDFYNKSRSPTPTATATSTSAPNKTPYTDQAIQQQSAALSATKQPGALETLGGTFARGVLPARAFLTGARYGALGGAAIGAMVPIAGETGISELVGGAIGGLIVGSAAAWAASKGQSAVADVISPKGAFSSSTEQAQVAAHPYVAMVGGGLSFGKPNPMNVYRAGRTLASQSGRAALAQFARTGGQGLAPQMVDEVGNLINVAQAGGLNSAFNIKDQIESGHFDPAALATAAATGLIFNEPWFHKPNPAAAAAAKVMARGGVPGTGPSPPTAPPGIAAPGVVPPEVPPVGTARPRVPGLLDFEIPPPASETARVAEQPLPEAPIPRPGTEVIKGGETNAPEARQVGEGGVTEHPGISPGENLPENRPEVRAGDREQAGNRGGVEPAPEEPVVPDSHEQRLTEARDKLAELQAEKDQQGKEFPTDKRKHMAALEEFLGTKANPLTRLEQIDNEINDYYDRQELPPKALHQEKKALEAQLQKEHEAELLAETQGHQERGGQELIDAVKEHGVPLNDPKYSGELRPLQEAFAPKNKYGQEKHRPLATGTGEKLYFGDVFKPDAGSMDSLTQVLQRKGFDVETPGDAINLIDERLRTGKKIIGDEARAQALEEQSYQDYRPQQMKHPFGGFWPRKEPEPPPDQKWTPANSDKPGIEKSPDQLDKDIAIAAKSEEGLPLPKAEPGRDIVATSQDEEQVDRLLGEHAYKSPIVNVVIKELLQNGFDAVREGSASEKRPGQISIDYDYRTRTIIVRDDGVGMSPETIVTAFLRTGGTKKSGDNQNTSGGLGVAKLAFLKGSKRIKLVTVKDGLKTVMDVDQTQIKAKQIPLDKTYTNEPNGTTVTVEIPETYVNTKGETVPIHFGTDPEFLKHPLFGPVEVKVNGQMSPMGIHTEHWVKDNRFNFDWGHADVYVDPRPLQKYTYSEGTYNPVYSVASAGLHQFEVSWGQIFDKPDNWIPHNMVIDVRSHVDTKHPQYPFDNQREGWRGSVAQDIKSMYAFIKKQGLEQQLKKAQEIFSKVKVIPHVDMVDVGKDLTSAQVAHTQADKGAESVTLPKVTSVDIKPDTVVTNYSTGKSSVQPHEQFNKSTFSSERTIDFEKSKLDTSHLNPQDPLYHNNTNVDFEKIKGAPELHAKVSNVLVQYMREFGRVFGKDPTARSEYSELTDTTPGKAWFGGISYDKDYAGLNIVNPFKAIWFNPAGLSEGAMASGPRRAAVESLHAFLHEITHVPERNEGGGFTREELDNVGRMVDFPYAKFEKALVEVYTKHWDTLNEINSKYRKSSTTNSAESFQAGSTLGPESKGAQGASEGISPEHAPEVVSDKDPGSTGAGRAGETNPKPGTALGDILSGQKSRPQSGAEPARPEVAATAPELQGRPAAAPVPERVSAGVGGIRDTLAGIKEAAAQPPETPEQRKFAPLEVQPGEVEQRPLTANEAAGPGLRDMSEQEMSRTIGASMQRFHEDALTTSGTSSGGLSHNDIIDAGRNAIRLGVNPEDVANSRAIPIDQKYTVVKAHAEDLREVSEQAEDLARRNPSQANKDAAEAAFSDYSNWDGKYVKPNRELIEQQYPGMPPEEYNPRSMTDLRQEMIRRNGRDFKPGAERSAAEAQLKEIQRTVEARNKELMKRDEELRKASPDLVTEIKNGDDLFKYLAESGAFPCI